MNPIAPSVETFDYALFDHNHRQFPPDQLKLFVGLHIAWSMDGTRIVASGQSREEVHQKLDEQGIHFSHVVHDYVDPL